jgi:hypothetical protein
MVSPSYLTDRETKHDEVSLAVVFKYLLKDVAIAEPRPTESTCNPQRVSAQNNEQNHGQ